MGTKEILTLQFGHYSNYVGTHWWNIQEQGFEYNNSSVTEINHDVLYREGLTEKNQITFTPRLLLVDLKGSLNSLPETGNLYKPNLNTSSVEWDPNLVEVKNEPVNSKNEFQKDLEDPSSTSTVCKTSYDLEKSVSVWSDFLYTRFHPRSLNIIKEYEHGNENKAFHIFPLGSNLWKKSQFHDEFCNKVRIYIEECDSFQGFHILTDTTDAFSGLSSSCTQYLKDEYDRQPMLVFPVIPSYFPNKLSQEGYQSFANESIRILNIALGFTYFDTYSSLFVPITTGSKGWRQPGPKREFNNISYDHTLPYHSSAILASALETLTLKYRLKSTSFSVIDLCTDLNHDDRKAAAASLCLPFSFNGHSDLLECLDNWEGPLTKSITPNCEIGSQNLIQYMTVRGISEDKLKQPPHLAEKQLKLPAYKCGTISDMLNLYLAYSTDYSINNITVVHKPLNVKTPYPQIFVEQNRQVDNEKHMNIDNVPVLAGLHNGPDVGGMLESLCTETKRIKFTQFPQFTMEGIENDEFQECLNTLYTLRENYENKYYI